MPLVTTTKLSKIKPTDSLLIRQTKATGNASLEPPWAARRFPAVFGFFALRLEIKWERSNLALSPDLVKGAFSKNHSRPAVTPDPRGNHAGKAVGSCCKTSAAN